MSERRHTIAMRAETERHTHCPRCGVLRKGTQHRIVRIVDEGNAGIERGERGSPTHSDAVQFAVAVELVAKKIIPNH